MLTAFFLAAAIREPAPPSTGHWQGYMQRGTARLQVSFDFPAGLPRRGFFSAPDLAALDIPLTDVQGDRNIHFSLVGDTSTTTFEGTTAADTMTGNFHEIGREGTFVLHRSSISTAKPYTSENVTFKNGPVRLSGTVFAPRTAGKHPAVIFIHGSGPEGRWATAYLADYVARNGIVALIYDKRGVGASTGDWRTSSLQDLANDARAGVGLLARRNDVDRMKIGVYGHSQGAEIAPAIAENNDEVHWIIAADGPVGPQYRQDLFRVDTSLAKRYSGQALTDAEHLYAEFVDVARSSSSHDQMRADIEKAGNSPWLDDLAIPDDGSWVWNWYGKVGDYDNRPAWAAVRVPVLLLFGSDDALVPPNDSISETTAILKANDNQHVTVRVFPGADHTLRVPPSTADGWPRNAQGFPQIIAVFARGELQH